MLDVFNDTGENYIFQILELEHDKETPKTTITWASKPGRFYSIEFSNDLKIWSEIEGSIVSGGEKTSFVDDFFAAENAQRFLSGQRKLMALFLASPNEAYIKNKLYCVQLSFRL